MPDMTVVEFATGHADTCSCDFDRVKHIAIHVDLLIETAVAHGRTLWKVGQDSDGRVSLIWESRSAEYWELLLVEAAQMIALKKLLGLDR